MNINRPRTQFAPNEPDRGYVRRKTLLLALTGFIILFSGIVIGVGGTVVYFRNTVIGESGNPRRIGDMLAASVMDGISLTDEESARIKGVIADSVLRINGLRGEYDGKFQTEFDTMCQEICSILGSDRARIWEHCVHRDFGEKAAERVRANMLSHEN